MIIDFTKNKFRTKGQDSGGYWIHGGGDSGDRFIGGDDSGDDKVKY